MEDSEEQESFCPNQYNVMHFLRNVCSPNLAELLVKEFKNSKFVKEALGRDREATLNKTLLEILKKVHSKGKKQAGKKKKTGNERSDGSSKTQHLNNLEDSDKKNILNQVRVLELVLEGEVHEESRAVKTLGNLDSALLLNILTNDVLEFPLSGIEKHLEILKNSRNSIFHNDDSSKKDVRLWEAVESVYKHLGKDVASFQEKKRRYFLPPLSRCPQIMKDLQQEIHRNYSQSLPYHHYSIKPAIKHLRRDCQSDEIVENLENFLKEQKACWSQEPRPILLCGAQGAGKSSLLHNLVHSFISTEDFLLVVLLDESKTNNKTKESFWKHVYDHLMDRSPCTVGMYGREEVVKVLENYSSRFLFLWDVNLQDARNPLSHMDRGTWVLSHQGLPENSTTNCYLLKVAPLSEEQVREILRSISSSEHCSQVLECYSKCEYKGIINSPDMVHIFNSVCFGMTDCVPFYKLIQMYIDKKIDRTEENDADLVKLGQRAFYTIRSNRKYYKEKCLVGIQKNVCGPFLEHSLSKGYFFKYRVVEDYLAAWYIVHDPKVACDMWLKQATLFKRVFEVVCALWYERGRESLCSNLHYVRKYLEKFFDISDPKLDKTKRQKNKQVANKNKTKKAVEKTQQTMELDDNCDVSRRDKNHEQAMEVDEHPVEVVKDKEDEGKAKEQKNKEAMDVKEDGNEDNKQDIFGRWVFLSKIAKEHQYNQDILQLLADLLTCKNTWLFKCKLLKEEVIDNISLVLMYIKLTKKLTIKLESGPNVTTLLRLWNMLSGHSGLSCNTTVHLVIRHTESNWVMHEKLLARLPSLIVSTNIPLCITKYVGPLLCSNTPHFLKCLCMTRLEVLDVYVCDLASLQEVLAHQQHSLISAIVRLSLKLQEQRMIPNITQIHLSSSLPLTLTITYFENLQALLDKFEPPGFLNSLKIYRVYIHENFTLNLTRFTEMESLFIRFVGVGKLPPVHLEAQQSDDQMEVSDENDTKSPLLPIERWTFHLVLNLHLPPRLERFLMRNLSFCDDSNMSILHKYWDGLPFQRLTLLDTHLSLSKFKSFLEPSLEDITEGMGKKFRLDGPATSSRSVVKHGRLKKEEREERRKHKPEGKELIITSEAQLCNQCHLLSCTCAYSGINHSRDTYEDIVSLVKKVYLYDILSINYSGKGIVVRKDMCGDLQVQCPLPFLDDDRAENPERHPELCQVIEALALSQIICLTNTKLSHKGAVHLLDHLKDKKKNFGTIEPFRLTISSHHASCSMSKEEVKHSPFMRKIKNDNSLQQFNFKCECLKRCHYFKKAINGQIYFNDIELTDK